MKTFITSLLLVLAGISYGQVPTVTFDPTQAENMAQSITASLEQLEKLEKITKYYEVAQDNVEKVNKMILKLDEIKEITEMHQYILEYAPKIKNYISGIKNPLEKKNSLNSLAKVLKLAHKATSELILITSDNYLKMTDKERIDYIKEKKREMRQAKALLQYSFSL